MSHVNSIKLYTIHSFNCISHTILVSGESQTLVKHLLVKRFVLEQSLIMIRTQANVQYGKQFLDSSLCQKKHTKPLFQQSEILNVYNLYIYHCFIEILKILKFRQPSLNLLLYRSYNRSTRHNNTYVNICIQLQGC